MFYGPEGVGRALTAKAFLMALVCREEGEPDKACGRCHSCRRVEGLAHPDIMWIKPGRNRKIKIEEIRKARNVLNLKPYEAPVNACVIEDAHMMTVEASNALLKILEEPPAQSLLILISGKKELLLPTVISRCAEVKFNSLSLVQTKDIIMNSSDIDEKSAFFLAGFTEGSPGRALEVIDEGILKRRQDIADMLERIALEENAACLGWDKEGKDALLEDIELLIMFFRDVALEKEGLKELVLDKELVDRDMCRFYEKYPVSRISEVVEKLIELKWALMGNANPKLVAQVLPGVLR